MKDLIDKIQTGKISRKIGSLFISAFLLSPVNFPGYSNPNLNPNQETKKQEESKKIMPYDLLPEEFKQKIENYTTKGVRVVYPAVYYGERLFKLIIYDIDLDGGQDVAEFYRVLSYKDLGKEIEWEYAPKPKFYCFNWRNKEFEEDAILDNDEVIIDKDEDGLNGSKNEHWLNITGPNKINKKKGRGI